MAVNAELVVRYVQAGDRERVVRGLEREGDRVRERERERGERGEEVEGKAEGEGGKEEEGRDRESENKRGRPHHTTTTTVYLCTVRSTNRIFCMLYVTLYGFSRCAYKTLQKIPVQRFTDIGPTLHSSDN